MLKHFWVISYDGETMGYDSLIQHPSELTKEIFDYIEIFYKSEDKKATLRVVEYNLTKKYNFQDDEEFFNSVYWNDCSFDKKVMTTINETILQK